MFLPALIALALLPACSRETVDRAASSNSILAALAPPSPAEAARDMVDPYSPDKRYHGTLLIANAPWGGEEVYTKIYADMAANDPDLGVRAVAASALGMHGTPEHVPIILPLLKEKDRRVRLSAVRALQRLHNPVAIEELIPLTRLPSRRVVELAGGRMEVVETPGESDKDVRAEACTALGQYAEPKVLQALINATDDDDLIVSRAATTSLRTLTGQNFTDDRTAWAKWARDNKTPFAGRQTYQYPIFEREKYFWEYIPLVPNPPNEKPGSPAGLPGQVN